MLRATALAFAAATLLTATGASAQSIDFGGRGGPSIDLRSGGQRERDFRREERFREREMERRAMRRAERRGGGGCREITIRERDAYGRMVTRTREECRR